MEPLRAASASASVWTPPAPSHVAVLPSTALEPLLTRLLSLPPPLACTLATQTAAAIAKLDPAQRPTTYEGLLAQARVCIDEDPAWSIADKRQLAGSRSRIGTFPPGSSFVPALNDPPPPSAATAVRLERLNLLYERLFPGQVFVTVVHSRPYAAVADELQDHIGPRANAVSNPSRFPPHLVIPEHSPDWQEELQRNMEAIWSIAHQRAALLTQQESEAACSSSIQRPTHFSSNSKDRLPRPIREKEEKQEEKEEEGEKEVPFVSLATFRMLALSSPVLESLFEADLKSSFSLVPPERSQSGGAPTWSYSASTSGKPKYSSNSKDLSSGTRGRVAGFLGRKLGEDDKARTEQLEDKKGPYASTRTVKGPVPSFGRDTTLDGTAMDQAALHAAEDRRQKIAAQERAAVLTSTFGSRLAGVMRSTTEAFSPTTSKPPLLTPSPSPQPTSSPQPAHSSSRIPKRPSPSPTRSLAQSSAASLTSSTPDRGRSAVRQGRARPVSLRPDDMARLGPDVVAETLRAAATQERSHFVVDEIGSKPEVGEASEAEGEAPPEAADWEDDLGTIGTRGTPTEQGRLEGRAAELAKNLRLAPAAK